MKTKIKHIFEILSLRKKITIAEWEFDLIVFFVLLLGLIVGTYITLLNLLPNIFAAGDTNYVWDFSVSGDYTLSDSNQIEITSNTARLKVRNYSSDSDTMLLFHLDESSGTPVDDSSSNNNDGTVTNGSWVTGNLNNGLDLNGTTAYVSVTDSSSLSLSQDNTLEAWTKLDSVLSAGSHYQRQGVFDKGSYQLYYDHETGKITYELADASETSWSQVAGNDINGSWDLNGKLSVQSMVAIGSDIYVGLGNQVADAEVWKWNGTTWSQVGGDGKNSSWADQTFEYVASLATDSTYLYAGLGSGTGDGEVWRCNVTTSCTSWTKIGGDGINSGWAASAYETVDSLYYQGSTLYAGLGASANDAEVWSWNGSTWTKIGGDSVNSGWTTTFEQVYSLTGDGTNIYAGLGASAGDAEVWRWNGSSWTRIGGDAVNSSWANATYEYVLSMTYMSSNLYAGIGTTANDAEVWRWNGTSWTQIGGDSLNSGWTTNYEAVYSLANDGTDVYAGLGNTAGDNEVWRWNGTAWSQIGGDGLNSGFTNTHTIAQALLYTGSTLYTGITATGASSEVWTWNGSSWTRIGGNYINQSWGFFNLQSVETMIVSGSNLYTGTGYTVAANAMVFQFDGSAWTLIGGQGVNSSWSAATYELVASMASYGGDLYVGLGSTANDAEVWRWDGASWTKIGGDSLNSGWTTNYETVTSLASYGGNLYAGLGSTANDAEIWSWNGSVWTKIGGDSINSGWTTNFDTVNSLAVYNNILYAGLGVSTTEAEVWSWNGSAWTKIGGDGLNSSWNTNYEQIDYLTVFRGQVYAGLGTTAGDAEVWNWSGSAWSQVGGDDLNSSWTTGTYERVRSMTTYNGELYVGLGTTAGESEVWKYTGSTWSQIGGDTLNSSWANNTTESVHSMSVYKGKLYAGLGETTNVDASIWAYGGNGFLQSSTTSQDTSWHHIAATYDGSTMKLYIDGTLDNSTSASLSLPDSSTSLLIGTMQGSREAGLAQGFFEGLLDEIRISDVARSSFTTKPYATTAQTVEPATAVLTEDIENWEEFLSTETANGGTLTYRISDDAGDTWYYWGGSSWDESSSTSEANAASVINTNIPTFTAASGGILWQAILTGNGDQQVTLNEIEVTATSDTTNPTPPDTLTALDEPAGDAITTDTWYPGETPYFSWSGATDTGGSGLSGYFVYFGTDNTADPQTAGAFQAGSTYTAGSLTSGQTYYLRIRAQDVAQNVSSIWAPFNYKFDNTAPSNPSGLSVSPSGYSGENEYTFFWSSTGSDPASGVAGYQYKTAASSGPFSDWSSTITETSVTLSDVAYQENENIFYLQTIDNAGNISSSTVQVSFYFAGDAPTAPNNLIAIPASSTTNSFAFDWDAPTTFSGDVDDLRYCYTINTLPSSSTCTFTSPGVTELDADAYANQPGENTLYVSARDGVGNINYDSYVSVEFTADTPAPGIPLNVEMADVSVKTTESWKLAVSWESPTDDGDAGDVASYQVYHSVDDDTYEFVSSTNGIAYIGTGLEQVTHYYKIRACDSANNCGAFTEAASLFPDGRFTEPAGLIGDVDVSDITTRRARVSWTTDRVSDSKIAYGTTSGDYFDEEPSNSDQITSHEITLNNLDPGTRYYIVAKWTDEDGNTGASDELTFETTPAPTVKSVSVLATTLSSALIQFTTENAASVNIYYGKGALFSATQIVETAIIESTYTALLEDLDDGTTYSFKLNPVDSDGFEYDGTVFEFTTLPRPRISEVRIQEVRGTAQPSVQITWNTNVETSSISDYYPTNDASQLLTQAVVTRTSGEHTMLISALLANTNYTLIVKGIDQYGNEALSDPQTFTTASDTRAPRVQGLIVDSAIVQSNTAGEPKAQIIVTWDTDELSTSQVEFGEGTGTTYTQKTQEDTNLVTNHAVVISGLSPSKVYHLRVVSKDISDNMGTSIDTVTITPKATSNALDLVINNLREIFGFLKFFP